MQRYTADRPAFKCDYIRLTPPSIFLVNGDNNEDFNNIPGEKSVVSSKKSCLEIYFFNS